MSMAEIRLQEGESLDNALRRFKRKVQSEDIIKEVKRHSYYMKPGEKRRLKQALARKRARKKIRREPRLGCHKWGCCRHPPRHGRLDCLKKFLACGRKAYLRRGTSLMPDLQGRCLFPVIGRQGNSPNFPWLSKFDPAVQRVLRIGIDHAGFCTLVR